MLTHVSSVFTVEDLVSSDIEEVAQKCSVSYKVCMRRSHSHCADTIQVSVFGHFSAQSKLKHTPSPSEHSHFVRKPRKICSAAPFTVENAMKLSRFECNI